jgi:hypothetical protein
MRVSSIKTSPPITGLGAFSQRVQFQGADRVVIARGQPALDLNWVKYDDYLTQVLPKLELTPGQKLCTFLIRRPYQDVFRNSVYKWFGNPCQSKKIGNLSCSEYTLAMIQLTGVKNGIREGWKQLNNGEANPLKILANTPSQLPLIRQVWPKLLPQSWQVAPGCQLTSPPLPLSHIRQPARVIEALRHLEPNPHPPV